MTLSPSPWSGPVRPLSVAVLGAGSLGSAMGALLAEGGHEIWLINRREGHVRSIQAHGLRVREREQERVVHLHAATSAAEVAQHRGAPVDLLVVLVKSFHTEAAMAGAGPLVGEHTVVLSLQNGLGHEEQLAQAVGRSRVMAGKSYVGGQLLGDGAVLVGAQGKETLIGELDAPSSERARRIAQAFTQAGLRCEVSPDIMVTMWEKLLVNVATGAVSAITRLPYGELYQATEVRDCALAAVSEAMAVARAAGLALTTTDPLQPWLKAGAGLPFEFKASMLQSLEKGSITEIDYVNGAVVRWGQRLGVPTPVNATLVACVKGIERGLSL